MLFFPSLLYFIGAVLPWLMFRRVLYSPSLLFFICAVLAIAITVVLYTCRCYIATAVVLYTGAVFSSLVSQTGKIAETKARQKIKNPYFLCTNTIFGTKRNPSQTPQSLQLCHELFCYVDVVESTV
jgi:hypothetical protein